jgi:voltage-gated potassium channel
VTAWQSLQEWAARYGWESEKWHRTRRVLVVLGFLLLLVVQSILFYRFEKGSNSELHSRLGTIWYILVFLISGADVPITSTGGQLIATAFILEGLVVTSVFIANVTAFRLRRRRRVEAEKMSGHTIICGWNPRVKRIIQQYRTGNSHKRRIVLLADLPQDPLGYLQDVTFVQGDPTDDDDLVRAGIKQAASVIVVADSNLEASDGRAVLITLAIDSLNPDIYTCVEVYDPDNICHLQRAGADEIVCLSQFGEYLVLQSAVSPGLSKMFMELLSFGEGDEVFRVPVAAWMVGKTYREVMLALTTEREILAVAAERQGEITVNPKGQYYIQEGDYLFVIAPTLPDL